VVVVVLLLLLLLLLVLPLVVWPRSRHPQLPKPF
jgi:hypothetical protein